MVSVRAERPDDRAAIWTVEAAAFGRPAEADLVDVLRQRASPWLSLVAVAGGTIVGHVAFSGVAVDGLAPWSALALGPMAVLPAWQRQGVGSRLVRAGLERCRDRGYHIVVVLGHPTFYPRFGFRPAAPLGLTCSWPAPTDAFMVVELAPGALAGRRGGVRYDPAFDGV